MCQIIIALTDHRYSHSFFVMAIFSMNIRPHSIDYCLNQKSVISVRIGTIDWVRGRSHQENAIEKSRRITSERRTSRFRRLRNRWDCSVGLETPTRVFGNLALDQREAGWTLYLVASENSGPDERAGMPPMRNRVRRTNYCISNRATLHGTLNYLREWMLLRVAICILECWNY